MTHRTSLGEAILKHWQTHRPQMVRDLQTSKRLTMALTQAQEETGDLIYELVCLQKMDYQAAWEIATREWALPNEDLPPEPQRSKSARSNSRTACRKPRSGISG